MISIKIEKYDEDKNILFIRKEEKNIWGLVSMMQFEDEMDYFGILVKRKSLDGEKGYVFDKNLDVDLIYEETKRFIEDHDLENREIF